MKKSLEELQRNFDKALENWSKVLEKERKEREKL
jgi:hypothetical protein